MRTIQSAIPRSHLGRFIAHFYRAYPLPIALFVLSAIWTGFWAPIHYELLKTILDTVAAHPAENLGRALWWPAFALIANYEAHNLCFRIIGYINYRWQGRIKGEMVAGTLGYLLGHTHLFFHTQSAGALGYQLEALADHIEEIMHDISRHLIRMVVLLGVTFWTLWHVQPVFFYGMFFWFLGFTGFSLACTPRIVRANASYGQAEAALAGACMDSITHATEVRIFAGQHEEVRRLRQVLQHVIKRFQAKDWLTWKLNLWQGLSVSSMLVFMLYFLIQGREEGHIAPGDFALIIGLAAEVGFMLWWAMEQVDLLSQSWGKAKQCFETLFATHGMEDAPEAVPLVIQRGEIVFKNVRFRFPGQPDVLFENHSVVIPPGQKVGLVGYSGSGKSTFVHLILRFYDVDEGQILIDGQDIRQVTLESLRSQIAIIPQDPGLFHRTLMDNIRYGNLEASDEAVIAAAKKAHAHEFISSLPDGYQTRVGDKGLKLSGGQRQRLAVARAVLKNAPILILDEATSQLDSLTEMDLQDSLHAIMEGKTTVVIAHRLSTVLSMDRLLVFDEGCIIEDGSHEELVQAGGLYQELWESQTGGFLTWDPQQAEPV